MLKAKIKISQVNNLTDARYFSAWGVDYLGFDINSDSPHFISPPKVKEISDWIEGPTILLEATLDMDDLWIENYRQYLESVIVEKPSARSEKLLHYIEDGQDQPNIVTFKCNDPWSSISISFVESLIRSYDEVYLDIPFVLADIDMILASGIKGLVIRGGEEEMVGFKSYDDLDEIFEHLLV